MKLEILIGPIASGKSTYCRKRAREGAIIVNDDSIVNALHANQYDMYDKKLKSIYKGLESYLIHFCAAHDKDVIIDRPNLNPATRKRYIETARGLDYVDIVGVIFDMQTPEVHAERRFKADNRGMSYENWLEAAKYHFSFYKEPVLEEGFTSLIKSNEF